MNPYKSIEDIPPHIFSNKELTKTPSPKLRAYLKYMLEHHTNDLHYLYRSCQQYVNYGGCYTLSWHRWLTKLERDLIEQENE